MSIRFQNDTSELHHLFYESHKNLITSICIATDNVDKINEFVDKYLGPPQKLKQRRDPKKPKRAKSSYLYYCDKFRPPLMAKIKSDGQNIKISQVSKILGAQWKKLSDEERVPYEALAQKDRNRYNDEIQAYKN